MGMVEIRDHSIWIKHIHSDNELVDKLLALPGGELVELEIDGFRGMWKKMDDGKDGRQTNGVKPLGKAQEQWNDLQIRRREFVSIKEA